MLSPLKAPAAEWYGVLLSVWSRWRATWEVMYSGRGKFFSEWFRGEEVEKKQHNCAPKNLLMHRWPSTYSKAIFHALWTAAIRLECMRKVPHQIVQWHHGYRNYLSEKEFALKTRFPCDNIKNCLKLPKKQWSMGSGNQSTLFMWTPDVPCLDMIIFLEINTYYLGRTSLTLPRECQNLNNIFKTWATN